MSKVILDVSMSLDGFIAGPNDGPDQPLGENGNLLVSWFFGDQSDADAAIAQETGESTGAFVIGRRMYDIGEGPDGWGDGGPNGAVPVFVLCHDHREPVTKDVMLMGANVAQQYL